MALLKHFSFEELFFGSTFLFPPLTPYIHDEQPYHIRKRALQTHSKEPDTRPIQGVNGTAPSKRALHIHSKEPYKHTQKSPTNILKRARHTINTGSQRHNTLQKSPKYTLKRALQTHSKEPYIYIGDQLDIRPTGAGWRRPSGETPEGEDV